MKNKYVVLSAALLAAGSLGVSGYADDGNQSSQGGNRSAGSASASGQQQQERQSQSSPSPANESQQQGQQDAPDGWILVQERVVYLFANEPQEHLLNARAFVDQKDNKAAAAEIRIAASYLDMQASRSKGQQQQVGRSLKQASDQLNQLADRVERGGNVSQDQLNQQFAKTHLALADFHQQMTAQAIQQQKAIRAGHDLQAACTGLTNAMALSGGKPDQNATQALSQCAKLANQLLTPGGAGGAPAASATNGAAAPADGSGSDADRAQQAGHQSGQDRRPQSTAAIPSDANQTVQQLGQAIDRLRGTIGNESGSDAGASGSGSSGSSGDSGGSTQQ